MIHAPGAPRPPVPRLLESLRTRAGGETLVVSSGTAPDGPALDALLASWKGDPGGRVLVLGTTGTHRDARVPRLRELWSIEERARASGLPVLTLRLAPIVGPRSPLWLRLRAAGAPRGAAGALSQPVLERDVLATLETALAGGADWSGWYDVAGAEPLTLAELAELAGRDSSLPRRAGAWEPSLAEIAEQRLVDPRPWTERFGIAASPLRQEAVSWA